NYVILVEMEVTESCIEVVGDSLFKMEIVFDEMSSSMTMNDNLRPNTFDEAFKGQTISYEVDKFGEVSKVKARSYIEGWRQFGETVNMVIAGFYPSLPDKAVKLGEKWNEEKTENPDDDPGLEVTSKISYKFMEMKNEKGKDCARIESESESTFAGIITNSYGKFNTNGSSKSKSEYYFNPAGGGIVKFRAKTETDAKMKKEAASPGEKDEEHETHMSYEIKKELK
ncbi:MAG: hypothetical protein ABIA59_10635, partial [Candidatus Latescibacterota bacterium]